MTDSCCYLLVQNGQNVPRPAADDHLTSDPHLPEMMPYVQHLMERPQAEVVDRNAALAFLALITAFAEKGLL
jgi:hypothetical protein